MGTKRVLVGYDHRGLKIKDIVLDEVSEVIGKARNTNWICEVNPQPSRNDGQPFEPVHYPNVAKIVAEAVAKEEYAFGILICGTGIGMSIAANKYPGIRAAHVNNTHDAEATRKHNDANVLCMGSDHFDPVGDTKIVRSIVNIFLTTSFEGGRHQERLQIISDMERKCSMRYAADYMTSHLSSSE